MSFAVDGKLYKILEEQQVNDRFRKREFVLEIQDGQYPQFIKFQLLQDRVTLLDGTQSGDEIRVHFDLSGREYVSPKGEVLYFTNLTCWKIDKGGAGNGGGHTQAPPAKNATPPMPSSNDAPFPAEDQDDLPF